MNRQDLDELKRQIPLMGYLQAQDWQPARPLSRGRWMGLCPLHGDHKPSFLVDANQDLFYCYGCGRGGDVIRFAELYHQVKCSQALALLRQWRGAEPLSQEVARFYDMQLHRHSEAVTYLCQRGIRSLELLQHMRIGYAPGGCLRGWLTQLGHSLPALRQAGLVTGAGYDAYVHRIVFPLEGNLYGRSHSATAPPHRFLPGAKGGLYAWALAQPYPEVILVEGLFDYAVLWQAGFHNVTCSLGTHLNARQFRQLCDAIRYARPLQGGSNTSRARSYQIRPKDISIDVRVTLRTGFDVRTVQHWVGHKSLETTMRYLVPSQEVHARLDQVTVPGLDDSESSQNITAAKGPGRIGRQPSLPAPKPSSTKVRPQGQRNHREA